MYNSRSNHFSKEFKAKALIAINKQIAEFKSYNHELFAKIVNIDSCAASDVIVHGHRWKDAEQVFHAMVGRLEARMIKERGPGALTATEAKALERMFTLPTTEYMFDIAAADGVCSAVNCDHYYLSEKVWD